MKYGKHPLTFEEQAEQLIARGLQADKSELIACLKSVNYYRLSGYLHPFRQADNTFKPNTSFTMIWNTYCFDRELRLLIMYACECFETAIKTDIVYHLSHDSGAFGYTDKQNFPFMTDNEYTVLLEKINQETKRSKEMFVNHFFQKYGDSHTQLPLWMLSEIVSFGTIASMYKGLKRPIQKKIAKKYNITSEVLLSWIGTLRVIRNICAHHARMYNRTLGFKPKIPKKDPNLV